MFLYPPSLQEWVKEDGIAKAEMSIMRYGDGKIAQETLFWAYIEVWSLICVISIADWCSGEKWENSLRDQTVHLGDFDHCFRFFQA